MSFPHLLRRSSFAQHDPLITRIYTSTPSSVFKYGDWGLKYPIHRSKGPGHIRVTSLDAGGAIGTDWRSGEREARFMETWASGRVSWSKERDAFAGFKQREDYDTGFGSLNPRAATPPESRRKAGDEQEYVEDIESMSEREFERYLDKIRSRRGEFLPVKLEKLEARHKNGWVAEEGDLTLANLGVEGYGNDMESASMQAGLVKEGLESPGSKLLKGSAGATGGLTYARDLPQGSSRLASGGLGRSTPSPADPTRTFPGRVLNLRDDREHLRSTPRANELMPSRANKPFVVSIGGVTAQAPPGARSSDNNVLELTDYTRTDPEVGTAMFRVTQATMEGTPNVVGEDRSSLLKRYAIYPGDRISKAKRPSPLEGVVPDIRVEAVPGTSNALSSSSSATSAGVSRTRTPPQPGSREWVAQEPYQRRSLFSREDSLSLGGPKAFRTRGKTLQDLSELERQRAERNAQQDQRSRTQSMLERLRVQASTPGSEKAGRR